jgi:uncharacterized protein involved in oxidation of intracellular sulfur
MKILFIINDAPYGNEKMYNALRLAHQIKKSDAANTVCIFLMADAVTAALPAHEPPNGYYNISRMLRLVLNGGGLIKLCGSCVQARGLSGLSLLEGVETSNMETLAAWVLESERVLVF